VNLVKIETSTDRRYVIAMDHEHAYSGILVRGKSYVGNSRHEGGYRAL